MILKPNLHEFDVEFSCCIQRISLLRGLYT